MSSCDLPTPRHLTSTSFESIRTSMSGAGRAKGTFETGRDGILSDVVAGQPGGSARSKGLPVSASRTSAEAGHRCRVSRRPPDDELSPRPGPRLGGAHEMRRHSSQRMTLSAGAALMWTDRPVEPPNGSRRNGAGATRRHRSRRRSHESCRRGRATPRPPPAPGLTGVRLTSRPRRRTPRRRRRVRRNAQLSSNALRRSRAK
jgi:hypothetical protein